MQITYAELLGLHGLTQRNNNFYVHAGSGYVMIGDDSIEVSAGDMVPSPKNIPHGLKAGEEDNFSVLVLKTPNPGALKDNN